MLKKLRLKNLLYQNPLLIDIHKVVNNYKKKTNAIGKIASPVYKKNFKVFSMFILNIILKQTYKIKTNIIIFKNIS